MTLPNIIDSIVSQVQSVKTVQSKFNTAYLKDVVNNTKNVVQALIYKKNGKVNSIWTQKYYVEHSADLQEGTKCVRFELPTPAVTLGPDNSGIVYAGSLDGCQSYALVQSRGELNTYLNHRATKTLPIILYSEGILEVYSHPLVKELLIDYVPANPTLLPTYNFDQSDYPLCEEGISALKQMVAQTITNDQAQKPVDYKTNYVDNPTAVK